jgi:anthranilate synthase component 2
MVLLLDNYDSFTYNLQHYLAVAGVECVVKRNNQIRPAEVKSDQYEALVLSPGPGMPSAAGQLMNVLDAAIGKPVLGVCLGHQAIGLYFGAVLEKSSRPMHGKISAITTTNHPMFYGINQSCIDVVRYHSLVLREIPNDMQVISRSKDDNEVMAIAHMSLPVWGIQFHPEAALTQFGNQLVENWVNHFSLSHNENSYI